MIKGVKVRVELSETSPYFLLGISPVAQVIIERVNYIPSTFIQDRSMEEVGVVITLSELAYS